MMTNATNLNKRKMSDGKTIEPSIGLPYYNSSKAIKKFDNIRGNYLWLFGHQR